MRGDLDLSTAITLFSNPMVAIGALIYFAGIVPLIEEILKTLVVAFIDPQRTKLQDAVLWGIGAGVGFAIIENTFNTSAVLSLWIMTVVTRLGATIMHVANGVTMGRGWYAARVERRGSKLFIAFLVSVFFHALWNGSVIILAATALSVSADPSLATGLVMLALGMVLIVLTVLGGVWIVYSIQSVREPTPLKNLAKGDVLA
jgi:RsiW-degrading membrane proteinase PrsW (M82 family)